MEAKPHLPASTQRMIVALRRGEKRSPHRSVPENTDREVMDQNGVKQWSKTLINQMSIGLFINNQPGNICNAFIMETIS